MIIVSYISVIDNEVKMMRRVFPDDDIAGLQKYLDTHIQEGLKIERL